MTFSLAILIISQLLFSSADVLARHQMAIHGFKPATFLTGWFAVYVGARTLATFGQLYVFTVLPLGRTMTLFGAVGLILANVLGLLILKEQLSLQVYVGVMLAIIAFLIVGFAKS